MLDEAVKRDFGGIVDPMEHRFAREKPTNREAIDAASQFFALPTFDTVGVAFLVQTRIGFQELRANPGGAPSARWLRASFDHLAKSMIARDLKDPFADHSGQAARKVELIQFENCARVGRPPGDWIIGPRKHPAAISEQETRDRQVAPDSDQPGIGTGYIRGARVRKPQSFSDGGG
jgi:hypothetical protein